MSQDNEFAKFTRIDNDLLSDCADKYYTHPSLCASAYNYVAEHPGQTAAIAAAAIVTPFALTKAAQFVLWAEGAPSAFVVKDLSGTLIKNAGEALGKNGAKLAEAIPAGSVESEASRLPTVTIEAKPVGEVLDGAAPKPVVDTAAATPKPAMEAAKPAVDESEAGTARAARAPRARKAAAETEAPDWINKKMNSGLLDFMKRNPKWMREPKNQNFVEWLKGPAKVTPETRFNEAARAAKLESAGERILKPTNLETTATATDSKLVTSAKTVKAETITAATGDSASEKLIASGLPVTEANVTEVARAAHLETAGEQTLNNGSKAAQVNAEQAIVIAEGRMVSPKAVEISDTIAKRSTKAAEVAEDGPPKWTKIKSNSGLVDLLTRNPAWSRNSSNSGLLDFLKREI